MKTLRFVFLLVFASVSSHLTSQTSWPQPTLTFVELNCENLFDTRNDSLKQDEEYLPEAVRRWTPKRYWRKLNNIAQEILSCRADGIPDLVALCEVENDSVLRDLTRRSLLRNARYEYVMTTSSDVRGVDVALLYSPFSFALLDVRKVPVEPVKNMRPTRDILYVSGRTIVGDTLHVFVVHAPSRYGGERYSRPFRLRVAETLGGVVDSLFRHVPSPRIVVAGDFNDYSDSPALRSLERLSLRNVTVKARGHNGSPGTYRYQGEWRSIDHVLVSAALYDAVAETFINDAPFLLEPERQYGGWRPRRTYNGMKYQPGYSDHLPLVVRLKLGKP